MQVTFDTHVWNRMVFPERYRDRSNYAALAKINDAIRSGQVRGFLSESFGTIESIKKEDRARFHALDLPKIEVTNRSHRPGLHCLTIEIQAQHSLHPGLTAEFEEELNAALAMGMKLLSAPYLGVAIPDRLRKNPLLYAPEVFATADYNERFGWDASAIVGRGIGGGALPALAKELTARLDGPRPPEWSDREVPLLRLRVRPHNQSQTREGADREGIRGIGGRRLGCGARSLRQRLSVQRRPRKSAMGASIFDDDNRAWLKAVYGVNFLSAQQLSDLL